MVGTSTPSTMVSGSDLGGTMLSCKTWITTANFSLAKTFHLLSGVWVCLSRVPLITVYKWNVLITYVLADAIFSHRLYKGNANAACLNTAITLQCAITHMICLGTKTLCHIPLCTA